MNMLTFHSIKQLNGFRKYTDLNSELEQNPLALLKMTMCSGNVG